MGGEGVQNHLSKPDVSEHSLTLENWDYWSGCRVHSLLLSYFYFAVKLCDNFGKGWATIHSFLYLWLKINPTQVSVCSIVKQIKLCSSTARVYYCQCTWRKMRGCDCSFLLHTVKGIAMIFRKCLVWGLCFISAFENVMLQSVWENWMLLSLKTLNNSTWSITFLGARKYSMQNQSSI